MLRFNLIRFDLNSDRRTPTERSGFTLIELMVVIAIILMAAGLMIPSIADFFRNKALDGARAQITATFNSARMLAVANNRTYRVVFFREGVRTYDVANKSWMADEDFNPSSSPINSDKIHFDLVFAGMHSNCVFSEGGRDCYRSSNHDGCVPDSECKNIGDSLPQYDDWWWTITQGENPIETGSETFSDEYLVSIEFDRSGTLTPRVPNTVYVYNPNAMRESDTHDHPPISKKVLEQKGNDVPAALFKKEPPESADIIIWQRGNGFACFIDLQGTGSVKSKLASAEAVLSSR